MDQKVMITIRLAMLAGFYPLALAWMANRQTTLSIALVWTVIAWAVWTARVFTAGQGEMTQQTSSFLALCLSGCAGVAVLGARRPGYKAWNFVVAGLLFVLLLPLASGFGKPRLESAQFMFLIGTLAVGLLNYLPTRLWPAVLLAGAAFSLELIRLAEITISWDVMWESYFLLALSPWAALIMQRLAPSSNEFDRLWLGFRDRFGFLWAQRIREQFNNSAASAGWTARLSWSGLRPTSACNDDLLTTLQAVLKRFRTEQGAE